MDHHSFPLSELTSAFHPLGTTLCSRHYALGIILSLCSLYLLLHGFIPHSQAPYQLCCAVFLLTCGWKQCCKRTGKTDWGETLFWSWAAHSVQRAGTKICVPIWPGYPKHKAAQSTRLACSVLLDFLFTLLTGEGGWLWKCRLCPLGAAHLIPPLWAIRISSLSFLTFLKLPSAPGCSSQRPPSMACLF